MPPLLLLLLLLLVRVLLNYKTNHSIDVAPEFRPIDELRAFASLSLAL